MVWRTNETDVESILQTNSDISVAPFIRTANHLATYVATKDTDSILTDGMLAEIECWLAAHFYSHRDQLYQSNNTGKAGATFQGQTGMGLDSTQYGQTAKRLDLTGTLAGLDRTKHRVGAAWLGKVEDDWTDYDDRET